MIKKRYSPPEFTIFPNITHARTTFLGLYAKNKISVQEFDSLDKLLKFCKVVEEQAKSWDEQKTTCADALTTILKAGDPEWEQRS